ncbi:MAG: S8 family peptidase [Flavobacterium sp.]|nr:S8 family peptidase [Flavobacterium sp.]
MKNTITKLLFVSFIFGGAFSTQAQTAEQRRKITKDYDMVELQRMKEEYAKEYFENHQKALAAAAVNGWPLRIEKPDGGLTELQGITENGQPLYYTTDNAGAAITARANRLQPGGSLGLDLAGQDMFAGVWDGGHARLTHLDLAPRLFNYDGSSDTAYHPTHVTGTIISSGEHSATGRGIAYMATAWVSDWSNDVAEMTGAATDGLLLSNHSYGLNAGDGENFPESYYGAYISSSKQLDDLMYNAPYYQVVVSAGNDRDDSNQIINPTKGGHDLITKWATAKNAIVVAAVNNVPNYVNASSVTMSSFSSWGPTDDNRIKPDIATKGVNVNSTTDVSNTNYGIISGTSMASPGITGTLLLLQQHYSNLHEGEFMRAATLKGLMTHTADEAGDYPGPDSKFGWGLINAEKAAVTITKAVAGQAVISELILAQGGTYVQNVTVSGTEPLMATIAWTDKGGSPNNAVVDFTNPVLVNDLDIRVTKGDNTYYPWKLSADLDEPSEQADNSVDNIEKVQVNNPSGTYTITVTHKGTTLVTGSQKYSLIVTGSDMTLNTTKFDFNAFNVWPNPVTDNLQLTLESDLSEDGFVTLYDVQGKRVFNQELSFSNGAVNATINTSSLSPGMYLVKVTQGAKQSVKKIIKQ